MALLDRITTLAEATYEYALRRLRPAPGDRGDELATPHPWSDRETYLLGGAASPEAVGAAILARNHGDLRRWADLADEGRASFPAFQSEFATREQSVVETEFAVVPGLGSNQRAARRAADACRELLSHWQKRDDSDGNGSWERWVAEWVAAAVYPLGGHEVVWRRDARVILPESCVRIAERRWSYTSDPYDPKSWVPRLLDDQPTTPFYQLPYGVPIDSIHPDKLIVHRRRTVGGHPAAEGLFSALVWLWLFQKSSWRDLMRLQEMIGVPPVIGYFSAGGAKADGALQKLNGDRKSSDTEQRLLREVVMMMTGALRAVLPDTVKLEALKFDVPDRPMQLTTTERIDKLTARIINGTDGVSSIVPGSRAAQQVAADQAMTPYRGDARYAATRATILFSRFVRANPDRFGADCPTPMCVARTDPPASPSEVASLLQQAKALGLRIPEAWAHEAIQVPVTGPGERYLGQPAEGGAPPATGAAPTGTPPEAADAGGA